MTAPLKLTRKQILAFRRHVGALDRRLPRGKRSLRQAAWAGLQDSMPRAAVLSIHARVEGTKPETWADPSLAQLWGPRYHAYVVAASDLAPFSLGRLPDQGAARERAEDLAARLRAHIGDAKVTYGEAGSGMGIQPNSLRYAAMTGTVVMRWEGARAPTIWIVPRPEIEPRAARLELARRYLHVFGPTTPTSFAQWGGLGPRSAVEAFDALGPALATVRTPIGDAWILAGDEPDFRADHGPSAPARILPSGDTYFLLNGVDRELLIPDADRRRELWTPRVWPGALLVDGDVVGTWRRDQEKVSVQTFRRLSRAQRDAVVAEAESLPLPGTEGRMVVRWDD